MILVRAQEIPGLLREADEIHLADQRLVELDRRAELIPEFGMDDYLAFCSKSTKLHSAIIAEMDK